MIDRINIADIQKSFRLFLRFNKYILRYWKVESMIFILGTFSAILSLTVPYIGKNVLDKGILAKNTRFFIAYTILGAGIYAVNLAINTLHRYFKNYVIRKVRIDLGKDVFKKIRRYSLNNFQDRSTGGYIFRVSHDVAGASNIINDSLPSIITAMFKLILITAVIAFINWRILILIAGYQILALLEVNSFMKRIEEMKSANLKKSEDIFKRLNEVFSHIYFVKAFGVITNEIRKYFHDLIDRTRLEIRETKLKMASDLLRDTFNRLFFGIAGFYGAFLVMKGRMTLGGLGAIMAYITYGIGAYTALLNQCRNIFLNHVVLERVTALFDIDTEIKEKDNAKKITLSKGKIEFANVTFGYKKNSYVLNNMSFSIPPGAHIALTGHSGCGKTTIVNLILRLYDVDKGAVTLDNYDTRDIRFKSIYSHVSIAPQRPFLFDCSIKDNIAYGRENASLEEVRRASDIAKIRAFAEDLPNGFDTLAGENACRLSEGQKQRIAIARAAIKRPKILIIDEAMSSLDSETEDRIVSNISDEFRGSTIIIVSHRLSTVKKMDVVYFLEEPNKMDIGTHDSLFLLNQNYRGAFAGQVEKACEKD